MSNTTGKVYPRRHYRVLLISPGCASRVRIIQNLIKNSLTCVPYNRHVINIPTSYIHITLQQYTTIFKTVFLEI